MNKPISYLFILFLLPLAFISCTGDENTPIDPTATHTITFGGSLGNTYSPDTLEVLVGDTILWKGDLSFHPLTSDELPAGATSFSSSSGSTFQYIVTIPGVYTYYCTAHGSPGTGMFGVFIATDPDEPINISFGSETPNKILQISATEALVSKLYATDMAVLNLTTNKVTGTIPINTQTDDMVLVGTNAYVITDSTGYAVINTVTKTVTSKIRVGDYPAAIIADQAHNQLILLSQGSYFRGTSGKIHFINIATGIPTDSIALGSFDYIGSIVDAGNKGYLLYGDHVAILDYATKTITNQNFISQAYYGGYFDATTNELILGRAKDFQSNDSIDVYDAATATLKKQLYAGIAPGYFAVHGEGGNRTLFILNEGRFNAGNASLSSWNFTDLTLKNDLVPGLGDVGNDIDLMNGKLYILLNGSHKIVVLDPSTLQ